MSCFSWKNWHIFLNMPIPFCSLELVIWIFLSQVSLLSIYAPNYFADFFTSSFSLSRRMSIVWFLFRLKNNKLVLSTLRVHLFDFSQSQIFFKASLRPSFSRYKFFLEWKTHVSSAKRWNLTCGEEKWISLIKWEIIRVQINFLGVLHMQQFEHWNDPDQLLLPFFPLVK